MEKPDLSPQEQRNALPLPKDLAAPNRVFGRDVLIATILLIFSSSSYANADTDFGSMLTSFTASLHGFPALLSYIAYLIGIFFAMSGIFKLRAHTDAPHQVPFRDPLLRFVASGFMLALPHTAGIIQETLHAGAGGATGSGLGSLSACQAGSNGSPGLDTMFICLIGSIDVPARMLLGYLCYLIGIIYLMMGIMRLTKHEPSHGHRGHAGRGTAMTFVVAAVLISIPGVMDSVTTSVFGTSSIQNSLAYTNSNGGGGDNSQYNTVLQACLIWVQLLGWISFIRGWLILRTVADGGQATTASGITHIIGGVCAANIGAFVLAFQNTVMPGTHIFG